jgi:flagellar operon protein
MSEVTYQIGRIRTDVAQSVTGPGARPKPVGMENGLSFSKHLAERIERRRLNLSGDSLERLSQAVDKAANKGSRDSVVFLDELAVLVNVRSRTVLTAIETARMKEGVFTNIDSVVVG